MEKYYNLIENIPLFKDISKNDIKTVLKFIDARIVVYKKDETIFEEGKRVSEAGIILLGEAQIRKEDYCGNRNIISSLPGGEMFGEALCCTDADFLPVGIYAVDECIVMFFNLKKILDVKNPTEFSAQLIKNVLEIVAQKALSLRLKINIITRRTTREKIMAFLLSESKKTGNNQITIPYDRQELADYLGVERSAMSFEISKLCKDGVIKTNKNHFVILKQD